MQVEIDAVATTPLVERAKVMGGCMDAMRAIWTQDKPMFQGR